MRRGCHATRRVGADALTAPSGASRARPDVGPAVAPDDAHPRTGGRRLRDACAPPPGSSCTRRIRTTTRSTASSGAASCSTCEPLSFEAYRAPTEHPLAIAVGAVLSLFGTGADRLFLALTIASFVALVFGLYALGRTAFTPLVGVVAAVLVITRFDFPFLAARGYIDPWYLALVVWAAVLELRRPRRGWSVLVLLALAAMLRPEAWVLAGLYVLWAGWRASWGGASDTPPSRRWAPSCGSLTDFAVTGNPTFSFTGTSELAGRAGAQQGRRRGARRDVELPHRPREVPGRPRRDRRLLPRAGPRAAPARDAGRALRLRGGHVRARRRRRPVGDLAVPARPVAHGDGAVRRRRRRVDDAPRGHLDAAHLGGAGRCSSSCSGSASP